MFAYNYATNYRLDEQTETNSVFSRLQRQRQQQIIICIEMGIVFGVGRGRHNVRQIYANSLQEPHNGWHDKN